MINIKDIINDRKKKRNTTEVIIETLKNEKVDHLEKIIKLQDTIYTYREVNKKLKARNRKLAQELKELRQYKNTTIE